MDRFKRIVEKGNVSSRRIRVLNKFVEEFDDDYKHRKQVIEIIKIIETLEEGDVDKKIIKKMQKILKEVTDNNMTCEIVSSQLEVEKVEKELDSHVKKYCGFSEKKPMDYVGYDISKNLYISRYDGKRMTGKNVSTVCNKLINILKCGLNRVIDGSIDKVPISNKLVLYKHNSLELFDIEHCFHILHMKERRIRELSVENEKNYYYMFVKNEFGGYILRRLLTKDSIIKMMYYMNNVHVPELANLLGVNLCEKIPLTKEQSTIKVILKIFDGEEMISQKCIDGYFIDLYFTEYKLAIECDENDHIHNSLCDEKFREICISKNDITFIRYNPDDINFDIHKVINRIYMHIKKHNFYPQKNEYLNI